MSSKLRRNKFSKTTADRGNLSISGQQTCQMHYKENKIFLALHFVPSSRDPCS